MQEDKKVVRINSIKKTSISDGPGIRMVIFFQGCSKRCSGCHNPGTWDKSKGEDWTLEKLVEYIQINAKTRRITLSGGEPLEQLEILEELVTILREMNYDIALYTGYQTEKVSKTILCKINYLKTGCYVEELRSTIIPYIGSSNQKFQEILKWKGQDER